MKVGDLIKWTDYKASATNPVELVGLLVKDLGPRNGQAIGNATGWSDLLVLCDGEYVYWISWQCEVINESR